MKTHSYASIVGALIEDGLLLERREVIESDAHVEARDEKLASFVYGMAVVLLILAAPTLLDRFDSYVGTFKGVQS
jgi:hypothetical protein